MSEVIIKIEKTEELNRFLIMLGFEVEDIGNGVHRVVREGELPVFVAMDGNQLYFEVDLGNIAAVATKDLYFKLLDANTEIAPVSFGFNNTNPEDPRLVLVESRETGDLSDGELLSVFDSLELAADTAEKILTEAVNTNS